MGILPHSSKQSSCQDYLYNELFPAETDRRLKNVFFFLILCVSGPSIVIQKALFYTILAGLLCPPFSTTSHVFSGGIRIFLFV